MSALAYPGSDRVPLGGSLSFPSVTVPFQPRTGVTLSLPARGPYVEGDVLALTADGRGTVEIVNGSTGDGYGVEVDGPTAIPIARVRSGLVSSVIRVGARATVLLFQAVPSGLGPTRAGTYIVVPLAVPLVPASSLSIAERVWNGITPERLSRVWAREGRGILADQTAGLVAAIAVCKVGAISSLATAGTLAAPAFGLCAKEVLSNGLDIGATYLPLVIRDMVGDPMEDPNALTEAEAASVIQMVQAAQLLRDGVALLRAKGWVDRAVAALAMAGTGMDAGGAKLLVSSTAKAAQSKVVLIEFAAEARRRLP